MTYQTALKSGAGSHLPQANLPHLPPILTHRHALPSRKHHIYTSLVTSIMLHGCESWAASKATLSKVTWQHNRFLRRMLRITRHTQRLHHITTAQVEQALNIPPAIATVEDRQLRFLGHVARLSSNRQPRLLLTAFLQDAPRARGAPVTGLPQALRSVIRKMPGCTEQDWVLWANSREGADWRTTCNRKFLASKAKPSRPGSTNSSSTTNTGTHLKRHEKPGIPEGTLVRTAKTSCAKHLADRARLFNNKLVSECIGQLVTIDGELQLWHGRR